MKKFIYNLCNVTIMIVILFSVPLITKNWNWMFFTIFPALISFTYLQRIIKEITDSESEEKEPTMEEIEESFKDNSPTLFETEIVLGDNVSVPISIKPGRQAIINLSRENQQFYSYFNSWLWSIADNYNDSKKYKKDLEIKSGKLFGCWPSALICDEEKGTAAVRLEFDEYVPNPS